jgi:1-acyl-sn-glycerol-3-phosphate acyltransferase
VLAPSVVLLTVAIAVSAPLWLLPAGLLPLLLPRRFRLLRVLWVAALHLALESAMLLTLLALWVAAGFGRRIRTPEFQLRHYRLVGWYLAVMFRAARRVLNVRVVTDGPDPDAHPGKPLVVFSRHAGPGDSFLLAHALVNWYDREPRIVLKDTLQWDPAIDVLLNRLPNRFISPNPGDRGAAVEAQIGDLATGLDENDVLLIFPEGGNFTPKRRARMIATLHERGLHRVAERAAAMMHVLAPRPGGVGAVLRAAPDADVVWVAHTGTDHMLTIADVWRALPMDMVITMRWWQVPAAEVPRGREEQLEWLLTWWERIDAWVDVHRVVPVEPPS